MATESPLLHDGGNLISGTDLRNASIQGTTYSGPNGSGQFLAVKLSTAAERTIKVCTDNGEILGILQNKPAVADAADVGFLGVSKCVAGAAITRGQDLMPSSTAIGTLIPYSSAAGACRCGMAYTDAAVGDVFTAMIYGRSGVIV